MNRPPPALSCRHLATAQADLQRAAERVALAFNQLWGEDTALRDVGYMSYADAVHHLQRALVRLKAVQELEAKGAAT